MMGAKFYRRLAVALAISAACPVLAQTLTATAPGVVSLGTVNAAISGDTVFRVSTSGGIARQSGTGTQSGGSVLNSFTLLCNGSGNGSSSCSHSSKTVKVRITPTTTTGRAGALSGFQLSGGNGISSGPTVSGNSTTFVLNNLTHNTTHTFNIGFDVPISGGFGASGTAEANYQIEFGFTTTYNSAPAAASKAAAITRNPTQIVKDTDLRFGAIQRFGYATGTITLDPASGTVTSSNNAGLRVATGSGNPAGRAQYTVTGEGGQLINVTVPPTFTMSGPGGNLTVNVTKDFSGSSVTIGSPAGSFGTKAVGVGGNFTVGSGALLAGTYSGTFNIDFSWN